MHGQSFDIMKLAAKTLINTLGENDYVNVAKFSKNVSWVTPCLPTLVQVSMVVKSCSKLSYNRKYFKANSRNKRLLFDGIDSLVDHNIARYDLALEFAYDELDNFDAERSEQVR